MLSLEGTISKFLWSAFRFGEENPVFWMSLRIYIELVTTFLKVVDVFLKSKEYI